MLIDVHADLGDWAFRRLQNAAPEGLAALMARHQITAAIVGPVEGVLYRNPEAANDLLFERLQAAGNPTELLPAAVINPNFPGWEADLERALAAGARAVKLYPNYHDYDLAGPRAQELLQALAPSKLPVICCVRVEDERQQHWRMLVPPVPVAAAAKVAASQPDLPFILACANQGEIERFLAATPEGSSWVEISYLKSPASSVEHMVSKFGASRLLFGTHMPFLDPGPATAKLDMAHISHEDRELIAHGNAERIWPELKTVAGARPS